MIAVPVRRPFLKDALEPSALEMRQGYLFRHVGKAETVKGCVDRVVGVVEHKLAIDADFDLAAFLLELPRPYAAAGRVPLGDAVVADKVLWP